MEILFNLLFGEIIRVMTVLTRIFDNKVSFTLFKRYLETEMVIRLI